MRSFGSRTAKVHGHHSRPGRQVASVLVGNSVSDAGPVWRRCQSRHASTTSHLAGAEVSGRRLARDRNRDPLAILLECTPVYRPKRTRPSHEYTHNADKTPLSIYQALDSICSKPSRLKLEYSWNATRHPDVEALRHDLRLPYEDRWSTPTPKQWEKEQQLIAEEELAEQNVVREPENEVQFERWSMMVNKLVDQLLFETYRRPDGTSQQPHLLESAWNNIRMLRNSGYPRYRHARAAFFDFQASAEARRDLSSVTRNIFRDWRKMKDSYLATYGRPCDHRDTSQPAAKYRKRREYFVGKLCHNLLVTPYQPCIYNYNTLISGFASVGEPELCQAVVDSLLLESRMRPTPMTALVCLRHAAHQDVVGFYNLVRRITADDTRGFLLRRKLVSDVQEDRGLILWARHSNATVHLGVVAERTKVDELVLEAVLDRLIDFKMLRHAVTILGACWCEGLLVDARYAERLASLCAAQLDQWASLDLLRMFVQHIEKTVEMITGSSSVQQASSVKAFHKLLQICDQYAASRIGTATAAEDSVSCSGNMDLDVRIRYLRTSLWAAATELRLEDIKPWANIFSASLASGRFDEAHLKYLWGRISHTEQQHIKAESETQRFQLLVQVWLPIKSYFKRAGWLERETKWLLFNGFPTTERMKMGLIASPDEQAYQVSWLVEQWMHYLDGMPREWKSRNSNGLDGASGLVESEDELQLKKPGPQRLEKDQFLRSFFSSGDSAHQNKTPVPAV